MLLMLAVKFLLALKVLRFPLYLPLNMKVSLVKALIFPIFHYCNVVVSDITVELSDKLQRAQNYCI